MKRQANYVENKDEEEATKLLAYKKENEEKTTHRVIMCGFQNMCVEANDSESNHITFGDASKILIKDKSKVLIPQKLWKMTSIYLKCLICVQ